MRKLHLDDGVYSYKIGKQNIVIRLPNGQKKLTNLSEVSGRSWEDIERVIHKNRKRGFSVYPHEIKAYLQKEGRVDHES